LLAGDEVNPPNSLANFAVDFIVYPNLLKKPDAFLVQGDASRIGDYLPFPFKDDVVHGLLS